MFSQLRSASRYQMLAIFHRTCALLAWLACALLAAPAVAQGDSDLAESILRVTSRQDPAPKRLELGTSCLAELSKHPDVKLEQKLRLAMGLAHQELEQFRLARDYFVAAAELAREREDKQGLAHCALQNAMMSFRLGYFAVAVPSAKESMEVAQSIDRNDIQWRAANVLGLTHVRLSNYEPALRAFERGLAAADKIDDDAGVATVLSNLGLARMNLGEHDAALTLFLRVLTAQRSLTDKRGLSSALANIGDVQYLRNELDESYDYHQQALQLREELGIESEIARSHYSLGAIKHGQEEYEQALAHFDRALDIQERLEMAPERVETLMSMGQTYAKLDRDEEADDSLQSSSELIVKMAMTGRRLQTQEALATIYEERGELAKAIKALRESVEVERAQRSLETRLLFTKFEADLEAKDRERRIVVLSKERQTQEVTLRRGAMVRNLILSGSALLAVFAIVGWLAWAALRRRNRSLLHAAEHIRVLEGILPICSFCKSVRDEAGLWHALEKFVSSHSEAQFSHGVCKDCAKQHYPEVFDKGGETAVV